MSRSTTYEMKWASLTGFPASEMSTFGEPAMSPMVDYFFPAVPGDDVPADESSAFETTSASFSFTVQVARKGAPSGENIVYFVDNDSMTHWKAVTVSPHVARHRCGRRLFSSFDVDSRTDAIQFRSLIALATLPSGFSYSSNNSSTLIVRPSAPVNSRWSPVGLA